MFPAEAVPLFVEPKKKMTLAYMVLPSYSTSLVNRLVCHPKTMVSSPRQKKSHMSFQMLRLNVIIMPITLILHHVY